MIRSNVGNVVTNGMQILSVGATTASRLFKGRADKTLRHPTLSEEENTYIQQQEDKRALKKAQDFEKSQQTNNTEGDEIDEAINNTKSLFAKTEESKEIAKRAQEDIQYNLERTDYKRVDRPMYINTKTGRYASKKELEQYKVGEE